MLKLLGLAAAVLFALKEEALNFHLFFNSQNDKGYCPNYSAEISQGLVNLLAEPQTVHLREAEENITK